VLHVTENYSPSSEDTLPYTSPPLPLNCALERTEARTYMFGGEQPCAVSVRLDRPVLVPGRPAKVEMNIINGSTRTVVGFTARLVRSVALRFAPDPADEKDMLGLTAVERVASKDDVVFERAVTPTESATGAAVAAVAPMDSKFTSFVLTVPQSVEGSVTRGKKLSVMHSLQVELKVRGSSPLVVKIPVYLVEGLTQIGMDTDVFGEGGASEQGGAAGWFLSEAGSTLLHIAQAAEDRRQRAAAMLTWRKAEKAEDAAAAASVAASSAAAADETKE